MAGFEGSDVTSVDGLAALYAAPLERIVKFKLDHVNAAGRAFIAASPFLIIATGSQLGLDCSPRGSARLRGGCRRRQDAPHTGPAR